MKLKYNITLKILIFIQIIFVFSCKTNKVPENGHLFIENKFKYIDKKAKPYLDEYGFPFLNEKGKPIVNEYKEPFSDELGNYVKQKPNKKVLFVVPLGLWLYDFSNPKFDSLYSEYYAVEQRKRNQNLLDSLYIKYNFQKYVGKSHWLDRFFYNNGEPPVLVDPIISETNTENLKQYFRNRGWRKAVVEDTILASGKKAKVQYNIKLGKPTIMDSLVYNVSEEINNDLYGGYLRRRNRMNLKNLDTKIMKKEEYVKTFFERNSLVKKGDRLDAYVIGDEITRMENRFKNMGYFGFNDLKDEVIYYVDTANSIYKTPIQLAIRKSTLGIENSSDSLHKDILKPKFKRFKYNQINITLENFDNNKEGKYGIDSSYYVINRKLKLLEEGRKIKKIKKDTIAYIINKTGKEYNNRVLVDMLAIERGGYYRLNSEIETRRNIYKVNNFNIFGFSTMPKKYSDSTLIANIVLTPMHKYSYEVGFESFTSSIVNFGVTPNITFLAKNLFGGAENLSISFGGSLGNIESKKNNNQLFNSSELSAQASLSFPRLLLPFNGKKLIPKSWGPSSAISLGYNAQYNIGLDRRDYKAAFSYNFAPTRTTIHQITLWNLQYTQFKNPENYFKIYEKDGVVRDLVYVKYFNMYPAVGTEYENELITDDELLSQIQNNNIFKDHLRRNDPDLLDNYNLVESRRYRFTQNVLISSFKYDFTYDQRLGYFPRRNSFYLRAQIELAGNVPSLFNKSLKDFKTSNNKIVKEIVGVPYSQFIKLDVDIRKYWNLSLKKSLNVRFFAGIGIPYGNSFNLPFDRTYSVGGPSDVRAWKAFGFGPGTSKLSSKEGYELVALENLKLLSSIEYRFPFSSKGFEGALFVDAGNIWGIRSESPNKFKFDSFYKELGIGGGWGIRWNISNFIIRFDFAYKFHDPRRDEGDRWYFKHINLIKPQINFAIDFPF